MKTFLLLPLVLAVPAFAGTSAKQVVAPAPDPCLTSWFAGGSVGYLTELEEPMYNIHLGVTNSCWNIAGWNVGLFAEVGYTEKDESYNGHGRDLQYDDLDDIKIDGSFDLDELADGLNYVADAGDYYGAKHPDTSYDLQVVPITLNVKFERAISGNLNVYLGAGLGVAWVDLDIDAGALGSASESDWVFYSQVFGGLSYNFTPNFEVYGGARWIYMSDADMGGATLELGSDCLLELGARFKF